MSEIFIGISILLNIIVIVVLFILLKKTGGTKDGDFSGLFERTEKVVKDEISRNREETSRTAKDLREEVSNSIKLFGDQLSGRINDIAKMQKSQLDIFAEQLSKLTQSNEQKFDKLQDKVALSLKDIQESNDKKLEEMRATVDEKLHATLEKRLGESFKLVSDRLELVHKGLGEMQTLASGVGDLKKVLTNVKTRGTWGEIQLENLIEQMLSPEQYAINVSTKKGSSDKVEVAIKLPGKDKDKEEIVWLPIDAKFPLEDYQRLQEAQELVNIDGIAEAGKALENRIKAEAKKISEKYLDPPNTTDFAIMFLPIEGLYAEVLRRPGLSEFIQREFRVTLSGPTTLTALLNSLQMGFKTLAIEKRSSEVWKILGAVKTEFGKFGDILEKTQKKLQEASNTIDNAAVAARRIERKLRDVQELPASEQPNLLGDTLDDE